MRIESKLCHVSDKKAIVHVIGWNNDRELGSALGEGPTVEVAEDQAILRLSKRLNLNDKHEIVKNTFTEDKSKSQVKVELPKSDRIEEFNKIKEPTDWSNELAAIDLEIERLKWSRQDEVSFLEKSLGYNSRNKITNYNDILKYLNLLKNKDIDNKTKSKEENINSLIKESDKLLKALSWDNLKGREYLKKEYNVLTRKELNEKELISFVAKLQSILNKY